MTGRPSLLYPSDGRRYKTCSEAFRDIGNGISAIAADSAQGCSGIGYGRVLGGVVGRETGTDANGEEMSGACIPNCAAKFGEGTTGVEGVFPCI